MTIADALVLPSQFPPESVLTKVCDGYDTDAAIIDRLIAMGALRVSVTLDTLAVAVGRCRRTVQSAITRLRARGYLELDGRRHTNILSVALDRIQSAVNTLLIFRLPQVKQHSGNQLDPKVERSGNELEANGQPSGSPSQSLATSVENCAHCCPRCGLTLVPKQQPLSVESPSSAPPPPVQEKVQEPPSKISKDLRISSRSSYSSKGPEFPQPPNGVRPNTIDEIFSLINKNTPRKKEGEWNLPPDTPIPWTFAEADYKRCAELLQECLNTVWPPPKGYPDEPVMDRWGLMGILQGAGSIEAFERLVRQSIRNEAPRRDVGSALAFMRSLVWERMRGLRWSYLPEYFQSDRCMGRIPRKPVQAQQAEPHAGIDLDAVWAGVAMK
jgi:hypothetical protein